MAPGPTSAAASGLPPRGDLAGRRHLLFLAIRNLHVRAVMGYGGDGNGWVACARGHRHWGRFGAAGLLLTCRDRVLLQLRAGWVHEGGAWAFPGGARDSHEAPVIAALREAAEEADLDPGVVAPFAEFVDDHGGWAYTTVLAEALTEVDVRPVRESDDVRWWSVDEVAGLRLHRGFAATWPQLRARILSR